MSLTARSRSACRNREKTTKRNNMMQLVDFKVVRARVATFSVLGALGLHGAAFAQTAAPAAQPTTLPAAPVAPAGPVPADAAGPVVGAGLGHPSLTVVQPSAATPPTPLPDAKKMPDTTITGVKSSAVKPTTLFDAHTPGQPLPDDPPVIRTLDDAIHIAFLRNPTLLLAQESALRTVKVVAQIKAIERPQISASATYSRLLNSSSSGVAGGGASPASLSNPFSVGLTTSPPASIPVALSSTSTSTGSSLNSSTGTSQTSGSASSPTTALSSAGGSSTTTAATRGEPVSRQTGTGGTGNGATTGGSTTPGTGTAQNIGQAINNSTNLNQDSARLTISQLIDITGIVKVVERYGGLQEALTRLELARIRQQTAYNVRNAYYNLLRATAFLSVDEAAVADSRELLRVTQAQKSAGVASQFDVLTAQTQLDNNIQALISARNQVALSKNSFANTVGVDPSTPVDPQPQVFPVLPALDEEGLITQAFTQRPEAIEADVNLLKAGLNIRISHRNIEPYLNVGVNAGYNASASAFTRSKTSASIGGTLTFPLYDGGATQAAVDQARSDQRGALIQKDQFVRGIKAEVQQSIIAVNDADQRTRAVTATVAEAQEALRLAGVRFKAGVGTQLDVNNSQTQLVQAQSNQVNAQYDYLGALARLSLATGTPE